MTTFPHSPRLIKGAIIGFDLFNPVSSVIPFQYNPDTMTRTLQPQTAGGEGGDRTSLLRLKGAPVETIKLDIELDATDAWNGGDTIGQAMGVYPQLSALEMLVYPKSGAGDCQHHPLGHRHHRGNPAACALYLVRLGTEACAARAGDRYEHHRGVLRR